MGEGALSRGAREQQAPQGRHGDRALGPAGHSAETGTSRPFLLGSIVDGPLRPDRLHSFPGRWPCSILPRTKQPCTSAQPGHLLPLTGGDALPSAQRPQLLLQRDAGLADTELSGGQAVCPPCPEVLVQAGGLNANRETESRVFTQWRTPPCSGQQSRDRATQVSCRRKPGNRPGMFFLWGSPMGEHVWKMWFSWMPRLVLTHA